MMRLKRRQVLAGFVATGAALFATTARPSPSRRSSRSRGDPEPLRQFPGFAEGFYTDGTHVYYIDETGRGWAPRHLEPARLVPVVLAIADLGELLERLRRRHWAWIVEHAVLMRLTDDRPLARRLLASALAHDAAMPRRASTRLHHLAAALDQRGRRIWRSTTTDGRAFPVTIVPV